VQPLHQIYLVPGFFGFARLGEFTYFHFVQQALEAEMARLGVRAQVIPVETLPTASIVRRGRRLLETIVAHEWEKADAIHLLGHSTGGLDARMMTAPHVELDRSLPQGEVLRRVRNVLTLATPHFGTPIAGFFTTAYGKNLLELLSLLTVRAATPVPAEALSLGFRLVRRFEGTIGINDSVLGQLSEALLADFTPDRREAVRAFMRQVRGDQGALIQLNPEGMDLFNASIHDHPEIRYLSFISAAPPPPRVPPPETAINPRAAIGYVLYRFMWDNTAAAHPNYPYQSLTEDAQAAYEEALRVPLTAQTNDGVVPSRSMLWGECLGAVRGDHLDVVGHFGRASAQRPAADWFKSGAGFGEASFIGLYRQIARVLVKG
jgi:hypothetical protein